MANAFERSTVEIDATDTNPGRLTLEHLVGEAVYDVLAVAHGDYPEAATLVGQLVLTSALISSRYGDEKLYFRRN